MNIKSAFTELSYFTDPKAQKIGKLYKLFHGDGEQGCVDNVKYYCFKYGILDAKTITQEEYEKAIGNN